MVAVELTWPSWFLVSWWGHLSATVWEWFLQGHFLAVTWALSLCLKIPYIRKIDQMELELWEMP